MNIAPSYQTYELIGEPFEENGKQYIYAKHPNTGNQRKIRVYSDKEYAKAYGAKAIKDDGFDNLRVVRGFGDGPILVVRNNSADDEPWLINSPARYAMGIGWYFISSCELPLDTPEHLNFLLLDWEEASLDERHMKPADELKKILAAKARRKEWVYCA